MGSISSLSTGFLSVFILVFFSIFSTSFAQIADNQCASSESFSGTMRVKDGTVGCVPFKAIAINTDKNATNPRYIFDYKGGSPATYTPTELSEYTYSKPGTYVIMQLTESGAGQPQRACATITVRDTMPPQFKVLPCTDGVVTVSLLNHTNNQYKEYWVNWGDGEAPSQLNELITSARHIYKDITTSKTIRVQGLYSIGACGGSGTKTINFGKSNVAATLTKLEILDDVTAELTVENPNEAELELYKQQDTAPFQTLGTIVKNKVEKVKVLADTNRFHCYKFRVRDGCATPTESNILCVSFIKAIPDLEYNTVVITPYKNLTEVKQSSVIRNDIPWWTPNRTDIFKIDRDAVCGKKNCYRLQIETTTGGKVLSNIKCIDAPIALCSSLSTIFVPDAFSPNGDGKNEIIEVIGESATATTLSVFDNWGNIIFRTTPTIRQWNGTINGEPAPVGKYFYKVSVTDKLGREFTKRGSIVLMR